jgi:hypothetical protein
MLRLSLATGLLVCAYAASAQTGYYSVAGGGAQFQIGNRMALPLQNPITAMGGPIGTTQMFPPLLIPVNPNPDKAWVQQTGSVDPRQLKIPPGVLYRKSPGRKALGGQGPRLFEVRTNVDFSAPASALGTAVLKAGGRTGASKATFPGPNAGSVVRYQKTVAQFGGPLQTRLGAVTPIREFVFLGHKLPCKHPTFGGIDFTCQAQLIAFSPGSLAAFGAPVGFTVMTSAPAPMSPNIIDASIPAPSFLIAKSASGVMSGVLTDHATSAGFPWTTGKVVVSQPSALGVYEKFTITGKDSRMNGAGTISLVSGALSDRKFSGPDANRGWLRLTVPEPGAVISAIAALAMLAACHFAVRRRHPA